MTDLPFTGERLHEGTPLFGVDLARAPQDGAAERREMGDRVAHRADQRGGAAGLGSYRRAAWQ